MLDDFSLRHEFDGYIKLGVNYNQHKKILLEYSNDQIGRYRNRLEQHISISLSFFKFMTHKLINK